MAYLDAVYSVLGGLSGRVADIFRAERATFARIYPRATGAQLWIVDGECVQPGFCRARDLAYALPAIEPPRVVVHRRIFGYPVANIIALIRHELGHVCDPILYLPQSGGEQRADDIAERATGQRIYYDANDVQTILPAQYPRPARLHR